MFLKHAFTLFLLTTGACLAQTPDCSVSFNFTATGTTPAGGGGVDNRQVGCTGWTLTYESSGFSAISLVFESSDGATAPAGFVTYTGTLDSGSNPATSTTGGPAAAARFTGYVGWWQVRLASATGSGTVRGSLQGTRAGFTNAGAAGMGLCPDPCPVIGVTPAGSTPANPPVLVAGQDGAPGSTRTLKLDANGSVIPANAATAGTDGVNNTVAIQTGAGAVPLYERVLPMMTNGVTSDRQFVCPSSSAVTFSATTGSLQLIALSGSTIIRVCSISLWWDMSANVFLLQGTGSNCAANIVNLSGPMQNLTGLPANFGADGALRTTVAGRALCINSSQAITGGGVVTYAQF